jgi:hypothetical protein
MSRRTFLNLLFLFGIPLATAMGGCTETENSNPQVMRDEIVAYVKSVDAASGGKFPIEQVDVTHLVEKYIKMGDSFEKAKEILLKNEFSVHEYTVEEVKNRKDIKITYRIQADYEMKGGKWWYVRNIQIFLGKSPQSERVDEILAKVNIKGI